MSSLLARLLGTASQAVYRKEPENQIPVRDVKEIGNVKGQKNAKFGLAIAAAGGHNVLLIGPPGEGKSNLISTMPGFMPELTEHEKEQLRRIYACNGLTYNKWTRPYIESTPGVTVSNLLGGGIGPRPGLVSLAHAGILYMDELPEYPRAIIESLRIVLETGRSVITKGGLTTVFQAKFQMICAMNPCPCGFYTYPECECSQKVVQQYRKKLSGAILDRIDITIWIDRLSTSERFDEAVPRQSDTLKSQVEDAIFFRQYYRKQFYPNVIIESEQLLTKDSTICRYTNDAYSMLREYSDDKKHPLSTRKLTRLCKVARTCADLMLNESVDLVHVRMAYDYVKGGL